MLVTLDLQDPHEAEQLLHLQRVAYRQEAELIGYPDLPPLREDLPALMHCGETFLGIRHGEVLHAALGYQPDDRAWHICRLVVAPAMQRRGLAGQLLQAVIAGAAGRRLTVSTAAANLPALALYQRFGFMQASQSTTPDGLLLCHLQRSG